MKQQLHLMKPTSILGFVPLLNIHATPNLYASSSNINIKEQVLIPKGFETLMQKHEWHKCFCFTKISLWCNIQIVTKKQATDKAYLQICFILREDETHYCVIKNKTR